MDEKTSILIIDGDSNTRDNLTRVFRRKGYEVEAVGTGREAIEQVVRRFYNVALLNVELPDMQGIDVLMSMKQVCPDMVVIMMTAYASLESAVSALIQGASAYLIKPLNIDEVLLTVGEAIEKQRLVMENRRLYQQARRELAERRNAEERFEDLSHRSPMGVYIVQDGRYLYANPQLQSLLGYSEEELLGTDPLRYVHLDDRETFRENVARMLSAELAQPYEYRIVNKAGEVGWVMETVTTIQYQGRPATLGNNIDITEHKQLETKMVEYEELDKLKTNLLSTVSHELRTPLAVIKGYSTMLLDYDRRLPESEKQQHLKSIDRATDRLTELVDHLLDMSRMDAGLMKLEKLPTNISRIIEEAVSDARLTAPAGKVISHVRNGLPVATVDSRRIRQVLDNLIDNAIKYSDKESNVVIDAEYTDTEICISVSDEGIGIPSEDIEKVFDRMYRAEQRLTQGSKGLGLGLSVCRGMVEAHGGRIWAESQVGVGSTFYFTLPLVNDGEEESRGDGNPHN
ncbi:MAG TPA: PAS domain S-box protein [Dehalococcoidia bacterium]|nr:PAS domain S-box protein [Dehalococcoidia bacterium]